MRLVANRLLRIRLGKIGDGELPENSWFFLAPIRKGGLPGDRFFGLCHEGKSEDGTGKEDQFRFHRQLLRRRIEGLLSYGEKLKSKTSN